MPYKKRKYYKYMYDVNNYRRKNSACFIYVKTSCMQHVAMTFPSPVAATLPWLSAAVPWQGGSNDVRKKPWIYTSAR
jgi:hypothetical protein